MNARAEWLQRRRSGLGGSDIAAVLGLSAWASPVDVWLDKTSDEPPVDRGDNEAMVWGRLLEDVIAAEYGRRTGLRVQRVNTLVRHPERAWAIGNIDRAIVLEGKRARTASSGELLGAESILEVKTASAFTADEWGSDDDPQVPTYYAAQGMWYLGIARLQSLDFACLIGGSQLVTRTLDFEPEVFAWMLGEAEAFWGLVRSRTQPQPRDGADAYKLFRRHLPGVVLDASTNGDVLGELSELRSLRKAKETLETGVEELVSKLKVRMGPSEAIVVDGKAVVTWKAAKDSDKTNWEQVARRMREACSMAQEGFDAVVAECSSVVPGSRRFLVK